MLLHLTQSTPLPKKTLKALRLALHLSLVLWLSPSLLLRGP